MIDSFYNPQTGHTVPSNFYEGSVFYAPPYALRDTGATATAWVTMEHYYQAAKTLDRFESLTIQDASSPGLAKKLGQKVKLRPDWESIKIPVMREGLAHKFAQGTSEAAWLVSTAGHYLQEGNTWGDEFWGVCRGVGENWLGFLLMARRAILMCTEED